MRVEIGSQEGGKRAGGFSARQSHDMLPVLDLFPFRRPLGVTYAWCRAVTCSRSALSGSHAEEAGHAWVAG